MPVTTSYSWNLLNTIFIGSSFGQNHQSLTPLANGGFARVGDNGGRVFVTVFDEDGNETASWQGAQSTNGAIAQLDNGNLVIVSQDTDSIIFEIRDTSGNLVVASTDLGIVDPFGGATGNMNPTVVAVAGGFQIGFETDYGTDTDTRMLFVSNAGVVGAIGTVQSLSASISENETDVASVVLTNGTVAYAGK
ncbi:MAG: hypothetical protein R3D29_11350 [Nitratireductor sp.]